MIKKVRGIVVAVVMLLSLVVGALPVGAMNIVETGWNGEGQGGSINIVKLGGLTDGVEGTGRKLELAELPDEVEPLEGVQFTIWQVEEVETAELGWVEGENYFIYYEEEVARYFQIKTNAPTSQSGFTAGDGVLTFAQLPVGTFYIRETRGVAGHATSGPFIVQLPMVVDGNATNDVWVYPKNNPASIAKTEVSTQNGLITWQIDVTPLPEDFGGVEYLRVRDIFHDALEFVEESLSVHVTDSAGDGTAIELVSPEDYIVEATPNDQFSDDRGFLLELTTQGLNTVKANRQTHDAITIVFETTATLTEEDGERIKNEAILYFNDFEVGTEVEVARADDHVHPFKIIIEKKGENVATDDQFLEGARFFIFEDEEAAYAAIGEPMNYFEFGGESGVMEDPNQSGTSWQIESNNMGTASFQFVTEGTYWIVEAYTPAPYNLLTAPIKLEIARIGENDPLIGQESVKVGETTYTLGIHDYKYRITVEGNVVMNGDLEWFGLPDDGLEHHGEIVELAVLPITITVMNYEGINLPFVGGPGTWILIGIGLVLVVIAITAYAKSKKKQVPQA